MPENRITDIQLLVAGTTILIPGAQLPGTASTTEATTEPAASPVEATPPPAAEASSATPAATIEETPVPTGTPTPVSTATPMPAANAAITPAAIPTATPTPEPERTATPSPTPTAVPTSAASVPTAARIEVTPTSRAAGPPELRAEALAPGTYASIQADGECLYLREHGDPDSKIVACIATGTIVSVVDGTVEAGGYRWQKVKSGTSTGWAADMYLEPSAAPPPPARGTPTAVIVLPSASLKAALAASPWPVATWPTVERIIQCESGGNPNAIGPGGHRGLMQVDPRLHGPVPADPAGQLKQAYDVYKKQGWGAWACY